MRKSTVHPNSFLRPGDHVKARRSGYWHHGVVVGPDAVVHLVLPKSRQSWSSGEVRQTTVARFARGGAIEFVEYGPNRLPRAETVRRALQLVGQRHYGLLRANCEHLAVELVTGTARSHQVERATTATSGSTGTLVGARASLGLVATAGTVSGLSAAGMNSGLASAGLGSMAVGVTSIGVLPAVAAVVATRKALGDDPYLPDHERAARRAGRRGTVAGAVGGAVATRVLVQVVGTASGAARLTSGLRILGSVVGGGMRMGTLIAALGPAAVALATGVIVYKIWQQRPVPRRLSQGVGERHHRDWRGTAGSPMA